MDGATQWQWTARWLLDGNGWRDGSLMAMYGEEQHEHSGDGRSVLQEQRWNNQGQVVQVFEAEPEHETYLLPGTKEKPIVQVDKGRECYPTSFKFVPLA